MDEIKRLSSLLKEKYDPETLQKLIQLIEDLPDQHCINELEEFRKKLESFYLQ